MPDRNTLGVIVSERRWRVGELAEAAGMTVRTLHHYEQIGLLVPATRTSGDHRLYGEADVERLYRIRALRGLGMSLEDIRAALDNRSVLADVLRAHLDFGEGKPSRTRSHPRSESASRIYLTGYDSIDSFASRSNLSVLHISR